MVGIAPSGNVNVKEEKGTVMHVSFGHANISRRSLLAGGALLASSAVLAGCGSTQSAQDAVTSATSNSDTDSTASDSDARSVDDIKSAGSINIGVFSDKAPFGYVDDSGNYAGYDIVFAARIAEELGVTPNYIATDGSNRVPYLESNQADLMLANFTVTDERAEKVDFTKPYMKVQLGIVSPESAPINSVDDLAGKTLIIAKGTTAETYFEDKYPDITLQKYDSYADAYNALLDGRGAGMSTDNTEVLAWAKVNTGYVVGVSDLGDVDTIAGAVHKGNDSLLEFVNDLITGSLAEERFFHSDYEQTLEPVFGDEVDPDTIVVEGGEV